ncbi:LysR family transcriptional regulator [Haloferula sp.]|uniref:LysR family transcriptional regulator n=1 Tax=Haloferula sp. TaxID=2497595 RepID=UPI003C724934
MVEVRQLVHAVALAEHRNFARAARSLNLSQPALSRSIQSLETQLGLRLFDRGRKGVEPTEGGQLLLKRARALIVQMDDLEEEAGAVTRGNVGEMKIGTGPYPAKMFLGSSLGGLLSRQPDLKFRVIVDNWTETVRRLRERQIELAVCECSELDESVFEVVPLAEHRVYPVVRSSHPLAKMRESKFSEIKRWPFGITAALPPRVLGPLAAGGAKKASSLAIHCEDLEILKEIVSRSDVIMLAPLCLVEREIAEGSLCALPCVESCLKTSFGIVKLKGRTLPPLAGHLFEEMKRTDAACLQRGEELQAMIFPKKGRRSSQASKRSKGTSARK